MLFAIPNPEFVVYSTVVVQYAISFSFFLIGVCLFCVCTINYIIINHSMSVRILRPRPYFSSMAPPSSLPGSRKRIKLQDEDDSRIKELESKLMEAISSNASLNSLADLTSLAISLHEPHLALKAIYACYRVFVLLISKGCLENSTNEQAKVVRTWVFERLDEYVRFLCGLLQDDESLLRVCPPVTPDYI